MEEGGLAQALRGGDVCLVFITSTEEPGRTWKWVGPSSVPASSTLA